MCGNYLSYVQDKNTALWYGRPIDETRIGTTLCICLSHSDQILWTLNQISFILRSVVCYQIQVTRTHDTWIYGKTKYFLLTSKTIFRRKNRIYFINFPLFPRLTVIQLNSVNVIGSQFWYLKPQEAYRPRSNCIDTVISLLVMGLINLKYFRHRVSNYTLLVMLSETENTNNIRIIIRIT